VEAGDWKLVVVVRERGVWGPSDPTPDKPWKMDGWILALLK